MAIETSKENICINHIIDQKKESFTVKGDSIIPDIKPDILNEVDTSGIVCIYKREISDGKVRIDGSIDTYIIYIADDEKSSFRSINVNLDFMQVIDVPKAKPDMEVKIDVKLKRIECKILNERKVEITAILEANLKLVSNENVEIIDSVNLENVQTLEDQLEINSNTGRGNVKAYARETLMIDDIDNLAEIMKTEMNIINKDIKISYNKVLAKADLNIKIMYFTDDNRINIVEGNIPVMGFIDIPDVSEDNICETNYEIRNIVIKPNSVEEHSIYVDVEIDISCEVYTRKHIRLIQDLYSPKTNILFTQKQLQVIEDKISIKNTCNIRENQSIPEIGGNKIYDVTVNIELLKSTILSDRIMYEGELELNYIFDLNGSMSSKKTTIPFTFNQEFVGVNQNSNIETLTEIINKNFIVTDNENIDINIDISFNTILIKSANINIIDDLQEDENRNINTFSLIIYYVKKEDTLWKIAKKFGSTVDEIVRINGIEDADKINIRDQLFIPRYNG